MNQCQQPASFRIWNACRVLASVGKTSFSFYFDRAVRGGF